ncbi:PHP domain-containing protein [candidate division KSB1 bacterium]
MKNTGIADLHIHTNSSDGIHPPSEILPKLRETGISCIAITDHDSVEALDETKRRAKLFNIRTVTGVELSAEHENADLHFLGYFIDHHKKRFLDYLYLFKRRRYQRAQEMIEKLAKLNIKISLDKVIKFAGPGPVGRPHLADALVDSGYAGSRNDAFNKYLHNDGPVYVEKYKITSSEVIDLIHSIGGAAILAHPGITCSDDTIRQLVDSGLDGIEIIHPKHSPEITKNYVKLAGELSILTSGGSDFHGDFGDTSNLGTYYIDIEEVDRMEKYCESKRSEWIPPDDGEEDKS